MAARKRKGTKENPWHESVKQKIQASMLANRLISHALGEAELTKSQCDVSLALIKKVLPDAVADQKVAHDGTIEVIHRVRGIGHGKD